VEVPDDVRVPRAVRLQDVLSGESVLEVASDVEGNHGANGERVMRTRTLSTSRLKFVTPVLGRRDPEGLAVGVELEDAKVLAVSGDAGGGGEVPVGATAHVAIVPPISAYRPGPASPPSPSTRTGINIAPIEHPVGLQHPGVHVPVGHDGGS
jgi:hypothetical protein